VGFKPNSEGLGLEQVGVSLDKRGHIVIDDQFAPT
jgi:pyruvate/2-oxoglutarate dehydrogenase complex dihydrolipoamide dehydrogenase (E3) component